MQIYKYQILTLISYQIMMKYLVLLFFLLKAAFLQISGPTILYVSSSPTAIVNPVNSGLAGGTLIYLKVIGHSLDPTLNKITIGSFPCRIPADGVIDNFISCYTTDSQSNVDISNLPVTLISNSVPFTTTSPNLVNYLAAATPQLTEVFPSTGFANSTLNFYGIHRISSLGDVRSLNNVADLRIGSDLCSLLNIVQGSLSPNALQSIQCTQSSSQVAGKYNVSEQITSGTALKSVYMKKDSLILGESFDFLVLPTITSISTNSGNIGGQNLIIFGTGFSPLISDNQVTVDGNLCSIQSASINNINCIIGSKGNSSSRLATNSSSQVHGYFSGGGLYYARYGINSSTSLTTFAAAVRSNNTAVLKSPQEVAIRGEIKQGNYYGSYYGEVWRGYFTAPNDGVYTFTGISDDAFSLYLNPVEGSASPPSSPFIYSNGVTANWNDFYIDDISTAEGNITLRAGKSYYVQAYHINYVGVGKVKINVLIPRMSLIATSAYEVQKLILSSEVQSQIIVYSMLGGAGGLINLKIIRTSPSTGAVTYNANVTVAYGCSSANFQTALNNFNSFNGYQVAVVRVIYDSNNNTLSSISGAARIDYIVSIYLMRPVVYQNQSFIPTYIGYTGSFSQDIVSSHSPLIAGTFSLSIGETIIDSIPYNVSASRLQSYLNGMTGFEGVVVDQVTTFGYQYSGMWIINFIGVDHPIENMTVDGTGLTGGITTPNITLTVRRPHSTGLIVEPIDARFLNTYGNTPNVLVKTKGLPAVCLTNCVYAFLDLLKITSLSLVSSVLTLSISNPTNLSIGMNNLTITFQNYGCTLNAASTLENITCSLPSINNETLNLTAGSSTPSVYINPYGYASLDSRVSPIFIPLADLALSIISGGDNGGYYNTISGAGFPPYPNLIIIMICNTTATILNSTYTQVTFYIPACSEIGPQQVTIYIGTFLDSSLTFQFTNSSNIPIVNSISPTSSNPQLKNILQINGSNFGNNSSQVQVFLSNTSGRVYSLSILSVNQTNIRVRLLGGEVGTYTVQVALPFTNGISIADPINADQFQFEVSITSVTPNSGSYNGGTLLLITGNNFAPSNSETQVLIGPPSNNLCQIQSITTSQIECRTLPISHAFSAGQVLTLSILTNSKGLATCPNNSCSFTYIEQQLSPKILTISSNSSGYTLGGISFITLAETNCSIILTNIADDTLFHSLDLTICANTSLQFAVPNSIPGGSYSMRVRNTLGESNAEILTVKWNPGTPDYLSGGSIMGTVATFTGGSGYPSTLGGRFNVLLSSANNYYPVNILACCENNTLKLVIPPTANLSITITFKGPSTILNYSYIPNLNKTPTLQLISSIPMSPGNNSLIIKRADKLNVTIQSITLVSSINSNRNITVSNWTIISNGSITFSILLQSGSYQIWALTAFGYCSFNQTVDVGLISPISIQKQVVSFAGGQITLSANFLSPSSYITVNSFIGTIVNYTQTFVTYNIPALVTLDTQASYKLANIAKIDTSRLAFFSDQSSNTTNVSATFDSSILTVYGSPNSICYIGVDIGQGLFTSIDRIRIFPFLDWSNAAKYLLGAVFEGSNNNATWIILGRVDQTIHSGWKTLKSTVSQPFRYIRFRHNSASNCNIAEIQLYGIVYSDESVSFTSHQSTVIYNDGYNTYNFTDAIQFRDDHTPIVYSVTPPYGDVFGGYQITIEGINLNFGQQTVLIDSVPCGIVVSLATRIVCAVRPRPNIPMYNTFSVTIDSSIAKIENGFLYVLKWSDARTWGASLPPVDGDSVYVTAGMTLLIDQDTPILEGITVSNGSLIFPNDTDVTVRTGFITMKGGSFLAGRQSAPLYSNLQLIMYGNECDDQDAIFGNKGIGCLNCKFSLYGRPRSPIWTTISSTISPGDLTLIVSQDVDWQTGEVIVVASTSFSHTQAEQKTIVSISGRTIAIDTPFVYEHISVTEKFGLADKLEMKAEVGLLSRNIKIMGDDSSSAGEYGAHLLFTATLTNTLQAHVAYTEFTKCGQPQMFGRHCIRFQMARDASASYVRGNTIHESYARIISIRGTQYLTVEDNVGYRVKGHNFFLEDGSETRNIIQNNLAVSSLSTTKMLQTDVNTVTFWITNPTNDFEGNHAAGGDYYGFWYQNQPHSEGIYGCIDICPIGYPLGAVKNNVIHSHVLGLGILQLLSRKYPCAAVRNDMNAIDPWDSNPSIPSVFDGFTIYKNLQGGILCEAAGNIAFQNFTIAENYGVGVEFYVANFTKEMVSVNNSILIGQSIGNAATNKTNYASITGVITPRTGSNNITNTRFYNYPNGSLVIASCSQCNDPRFFTNLGNDIFLKNISFSSINGSFLRMMGLKRDVIYDLDASLAPYFDNVPRTSASLVWKYNHLADYNQNDCFPSSNSPLWDDVIMCNQNITIRRVYFTNVNNAASFLGQNLKAMQLINLQQVVDPQISAYNYTTVNGLLNGNQPTIQKIQTWSLPFISGRYYQIWWGLGLDFTHLSIVSSPAFTEKDSGILFKFNYTASRQIYSVSPMWGGILSNSSLIEDLEYPQPSSCVNGQYYHNNDNSNLRMLAVCQSGKSKKIFEYTEIKSGNCNSSCPPSAFVTWKQSFIRKWSNASQWPGGKVPAAMENVTVDSSWTILLDIDPAPANYMIIDGAVVAEDTRNVNITARSIFIRAGSITAGSLQNPFRHKFTIQIINTKDDNGWYLDALVSGNKHLLVTGSLNLYGRYPSTTKTTLAQSAFAGDTTIYVANSSQWVIGDNLALSPSYANYSEYEIVIISAVHSNNSIDIVSPLKFNHYGSTSLITSKFGQIDVNTYIGHLNRNIQIVPGPDYNWGVNILVYGFMDGPTYRAGSVTLSGVQIQDGGQEDTSSSALQFLNVVNANDSLITGTSFINCKAWCVNLNNVQNVIFTNNVFYNAWVFGVQAFGISQFVFNNNIMIGITQRPSATFGSELIACFATYEYINPFTSNTSIKNNLCLGSQGHGFAFPHIQCNQLEINPMANNTAGSCQIGFIFTDIPTPDNCKAFSYINAYACEIGQICSPPNTYQLVFSKFMLVDNQRGATLRFGAGQGTDSHSAILSDSYIAAVSRPTCSYCYGNLAISCTSSIGVRLLAVTQGGEILPNVFGPLFDRINLPELYQSKVFMYNVTFDSFRENYANSRVSNNCSHNYALRPHSQAWNKIGDTTLMSCFCTNCDDSSLFLGDADISSEVGLLGGCGDRQCLGKSNYLIIDWSGTFLGFIGTILPNNPMIGLNEPGCTFSGNMNSYLCKRTDLGVLAFQSLADDWSTKIMLPINLIYDGSNYATTINGWKQRNSNGSEPLSPRLARLAAIVKLNSTYNITFTAMPPLKMKFQIQKRSEIDNTSNYIIAKIQYPLPNMIQIMVNNMTIDPIILTDSGTNRSLNTSVCGDNIYFFTNYTIHFVVTQDKNCIVHLSLAESIRLTTHFAVSPYHFFASNAIVPFLDSLNSLLGRNNAFGVTLVGVNTGSTVLDVMIVNQNGNSTLNSTNISANLSDAHASLSTIINAGVYSQSMHNATGFSVIASTNTLYLLDNPASSSSDNSLTGIAGFILIAILILASAAIVLILVLLHILRRRVKITEVSQGKHLSKDLRESNYEIVNIQDFYSNSNEWNNPDLSLDKANSYEIMEMSSNENS